MPHLRLATALAPLITLGLACLPAQAQPSRGIETPGGTYPFPSGSHPLSFWTAHPLDRRVRNDYLIGLPAPDGAPITTSDYILDQQTRVLGTPAGHAVIEVLLFIRSGPRLLSPDQPNASPDFWRTVLIQTSEGDHYQQIYGLQEGGGNFAPPAFDHLFGPPDEPLLRVYDPDTGNGGGCSEGFWRFDRAGAHPIDLTPLRQAIQNRLPPATSFTSGCWALHPEQNLLTSAVQRLNARCLACGIVGEFSATYRITRGTAELATFRYSPTNNPTD